MKIFSSSSDTKLTKLISRNLIQNGCISDIGLIQIDKFSDGEILPIFRESIRDEDIYFISSTNTSDSIVESLLVVDAAKRSGCNSFTFISPFSGYARQDKVDVNRSSIGSKMMADIFEKVGITRMITIDLHSSSISGFYNIPVIHLNGNVIFVKYINSLVLDNICIASPDHGGIKRASNFQKFFPESSFVVIDKKRIKPGEVHSMDLTGTCEGKNVLIVDDMIDSGGTIAKASQLLIDNGAKSVYAICTHPVLSGNAIENIENSKLTQLIISDTISSIYDKSKLCDKIKVISCCDIISDSIIAISKRKSISELNLI